MTAVFQGNNLTSLIYLHHFKFDHRKKKLLPLWVYLMFSWVPHFIKIKPWIDYSENNRKTKKKVEHE